MGIGQTHIRHCILYEYKKGLKPYKKGLKPLAAINICSAYKNEASSICICQRWFKPGMSNLFS